MTPYRATSENNRCIRWTRLQWEACREADAIDRLPAEALRNAHVRLYMCVCVCMYVYAMRRTAI